MKRFVIANWKMHPESGAQASELVARISDWLDQLLAPPAVDLVLCPPFVFLDEVATLARQGRMPAIAQVGAQDLAAYDDDGAQTGEVSAAQLVASGVRYVIIGHSERRHKLGETDAVIHEKLLAALRHELVPVLCVGERHREAGWETELAVQVRGALEGLDGPDLARVIIAYEPIWAISTTPGARPDTPASAAEAVRVIRDIVGKAPHVLYGGSVTAHNALLFCTDPAFAGVLIGGASVKPDMFVRILALIAKP
jgi:triosephosphate isomerase